MGQTLTHGVYLPDEGERNCYSGLAANWQILDSSVGTIAEHTSQIAGKAPAVHTHTKSDITDFPAYGNTAGTICEGNDSRLSDARIPVAHTHTKADITDLFNSANTWSGYNIFTSYIASRESAVIPAGGYGKGVAFQNYQGNRLGYIQPHLTSNNAKRLLIGADSGDVAINSSLIPHVNNSYDLGSSSNQWKTLNGINPGALSLPSSSYMEIDTTNWDKTGATSQSYTPTVNGWLFIAIQNIAGNYLSINSGRGAISMDGTGAQNGLRATLLVTANESVSITVKTGSIFAARFYPCLGNV